MKASVIIALAGLVAACASRTVPLPSGADTFSTHCASCHGPLGEGDGPVAEVIAGAVPNLRTLARRNGGEFPAEAVASYIDGRQMPAAHGVRIMPVWGAVFDTTPEVVEGAQGAGPRIETILEVLRELQVP